MFIMKECCVCGANENETRIIGNLCRKHYLQKYRHGKILEHTIYDKNEIIVKDGVAYMSLYDKTGQKVAETMFSERHIERVKNIKWYARKGTNCKTLYVMGSMKDNVKIFLHRFILNVSNEMYVDHINGNGLDNRDENIRICSQAENSRNRIYSSSIRRYPGVYQPYGENKKWYAKITYMYKDYYLGVYDTFEEALEARKKAEEQYFGEYKASSGQLK